MCFLTNFRNPANYNQKGKKYSSRGFLVIDFVKLGDDTIPADSKRFTNYEDYEANLKVIETRGFNIVYGNIWTGLFKYYQYRNDENKANEMKEPLVLERGRVYGLSNAGLDEWQKVIRGKALFSSLLEESEKDVETLPKDEVG